MTKKCTEPVAEYGNGVFAWLYFIHCQYLCQNQQQKQITRGPGQFDVFRRHVSGRHYHLWHILRDCWRWRATFYFGIFASLVDQEFWFLNLIVVYKSICKNQMQSNLVGCVFFTLKAHQLSLLNKFDWKKVEFYSAVVTTIILAVCALSTFILSVSWKGKSRGYGSLGPGQKVDLWN